MSMFYELMMRKKEETMYATIKGSPTESPEGVFSGFSASNYLRINQTIVWDNNAEIVCTFTMPSSALTNAMTNLFVGKYSSSARNGFTIYTTGGKSYIYANLNLAGVDTNTYINIVPLELGQTYTAKLIFNGSSYLLCLYQNGIKLGEKTISSSSIMSTNSGFFIGSFENSNFFTGSIDLNNSYIKLGSTKYNLQAVVGYTVVGSPTITDGVVSGFQAYPNVNSGYYVKIANFTYNNTFEIKVKIRTGETIGGTILGQGNPAPRAGIPATSLRNTNFSFNIKDQNNQDIVNLVNIGYVNERTLIVDTDYILTLKFTGTEYIYTLVDMNGAYYINRVISSSAKLRVGCLAFGINYADVAYSAWSGAIDMNETWIKTDNKLFFNGQQA